MTTSKNNSTQPVKAVAVRLETDKFFVVLNDGREIGVPYKWYARLAAATPAQRADWRLIGQGTGIHWEDLDEDLSVEGLLRPESTQVGATLVA